MPSKPVSAKQLEANRSNAIRSTGPRTSEGKTRSSQNAMKHGIFAQDVVIRDGDGAEDPAEFDALLEQLTETLQPVGVLEQAAVHRIATCHWRLRRVCRFEVGATRQRLDECKRATESSQIDETERLLEEARQWQAWATGCLAWAERQESVPDAEMWNAFDAPVWQSIEQEFKGADILHAVDCPEARPECLLRLADLGLDTKGLWKRLVAIHRRCVEEGRARVDEREVQLRDARRYSQLAQDRSALVRSLPPERALNMVIRYETMLTRQLDRTTHQLERLQRFRRGDQVPPPVVLDVSVSDS